MPTVLNIKGGGSVQVYGGLDEATEIIRRKKEYVQVRALKNNHDVMVRTDEVLAVEVIPEAEYEQKQKEAAEKAEAEAKKNPSPGREPMRIIPSGKLPR